MKIVIKAGAQTQLWNFSEHVAERIILKIEWLALFCGSIKHLALRGSYSSLYKLRIGDWRAIYEIDQGNEVIIIHRIGHRRDVYEGL